MIEFAGPIFYLDLFELLLVRHQVFLYVIETGERRLPRLKQNVPESPYSPRESVLLSSLQDFGFEEVVHTEPVRLEKSFTDSL